MTDYNKQHNVRVQVLINLDRFNQITKLAELTGSSISRIVRLALDSKADEFDQAIKKARLHSAQEDWTK